MFQNEALQVPNPSVWNDEFVETDKKYDPQPSSTVDKTDWIGLGYFLFISSIPKHLKEV